MWHDRRMLSRLGSGEVWDMRSDPILGGGVLLPLSGCSIPILPCVSTLVPDAGVQPAVPHAGICAGAAREGRPYVVIETVTLAAAPGQLEQARSSGCGMLRRIGVAGDGVGARPSSCSFSFHGLIGA